MSEKDYLDEQSHHAQAGIAAALHDLEKDLGQAARACIKEHPFLTLAAVAAAGIVATELITSRRQPAARQTAVRERPAAKTSPMGEIIKELAKTIVLPAIIAAVETAGAAKAERRREESTNA